MTIPPELKCALCHDLLRDAVSTWCCSETFCDDCIRDALLSSDEHLCPKCGDVCPPAMLAPNKYIRNRVIDFANASNYVPKKEQQQQNPVSQEAASTPGQVETPQSEASQQSPPSKVEPAEQQSQSPLPQQSQQLPTSQNQPNQQGIIFMMPQYQQFA